MNKLVIIRILKAFYEIMDRCRSKKLLIFLKILTISFFLNLYVILLSHSISLTRSKFINLLFFYYDIYNKRRSLFFYKFLIKNNINYVKICLYYFFSKFRLHQLFFINMLMFKKFKLKNEKKLFLYKFEFMNLIGLNTQKFKPLFSYWAIFYLDYIVLFLNKTIYNLWLHKVYINWCIIDYYYVYLYQHDYFLSFNFIKDTFILYNQCYKQFFFSISYKETL